MTELWHETLFRVAAGGVLLVLGWQLYRFGIKAIGFYLGFISGAAVWELVLALTEGKVDLPQGDAANLAAGVVLGIIGAMKMFTAAYVSTRGGPGYATHFFSLHIYVNAFSQFYMGYASALSWLFFMLMLFFTFVQFRLSRSWVYYAGGEK